MLDNVLTKEDLKNVISSLLNLKHYINLDLIRNEHYYPDKMKDKLKEDLMNVESQIEKIAGVYARMEVFGEDNV